MAFIGPPEGIKVLSVTELTAAVKGLLEDGYPSAWVSGEIGNVARPPSGHLYFSLKDKNSQLRAVIWRGVALRLRFEPQNGMEVLAHGGLTVYPGKGEYQLVVRELQPRGEGALELALRQLREKLFRMGYFDPKRKKPLPRYPRRIALVTSPSGAAVRDMLEILGRRWPAAEVWVCPTRVQGDGAGDEIAAAVQLLNRLGQVDVLIVGRGGGSKEDLAAFNEELVAHAIFRSRIPVVSAVGHEIDVTIADLVADLRAVTPSEAAEKVAPDVFGLRQSVQAAEGRLCGLLLQRLEQARVRLDDLAQRRAFRLPQERIRDLERRLDEWNERLRRVVGQRLSRAREQLESGSARLDTLSPLNVLRRGYSLTRKAADLAVVRNPEQVRPGDVIVTDLQHGRVYSRVEEEPGAPCGA
jgi:exodeoxyribonuclease VII large subunit